MGGKQILNDAGKVDAVVIGLDRIVEVIEKGSDAPGPILDDRSDAFRRRLEAANMIIAKGQGNFEIPSEKPCPNLLLFQTKYPVITKHAGGLLKSHVLMRTSKRCTTL